MLLVLLHSYQQILDYHKEHNDVMMVMDTCKRFKYVSIDAWDKVGWGEMGCGVVGWDEMWWGWACPESHKPGL